MMTKDSKVIITGAAGFIASCLGGYMNSLGYNNLYLVDDFSRIDKNNNLDGLQYTEKVDRNQLFDWLQTSGVQIDAFFHLGARTDTTEMDYEVHRVLNLVYTQDVWSYCAANGIPLVYASSAATYGEGEHGYNDDHDVVGKLAPLNPYGRSKNEFDKWALQEIAEGHTAPPFWAGLKFFNVYGPNESHKKRMASVIFHAYNQILEQGKARLFRSHRPEYVDGGQQRDFVYVKDVINVCLWLMQNQPESGLYNLGTGKARSFNDLVGAIFSALDMQPNIEYVDTPIDIRDKYQYFTEANMNKLKLAGYDQSFYTLEEGVKDYVLNYLKK
jgi:ADP-L-glycero-D-manno-heptose 6-epimerase